MSELAFQTGQHLKSIMSSDEVLVFQFALGFYILYLGYRLLNRFAEISEETMAEENIIKAKEAFTKKLVQQQLESGQYWVTEDARVLAQEKFVVALLLLMACIASFMYVTGYSSRVTVLRKRWFIKNRLVPYLKRFFFKDFFG